MYKHSFAFLKLLYDEGSEYPLNDKNNKTSSPCFYKFDPDRRINLPITNYNTTEILSRVQESVAV